MKNRKKYLKLGLITIAIIFVAFALLPQVIVKDWTNSSMGFYNRMMILYYSFSILGAVGTCAAVVVALFSDEIKMWMYKPRVNVNLKDDNGYDEKIDITQQTPIAECYSCIIELTNDGVVDAKNSVIRITDVEYGKTKDKTRSVKNWMGTKAVNREPFDISTTYPYELRLLSVKNPVFFGTPNDNTDSIPPLLSIYGMPLDDRYRKKGVWKIHYCFVSQNAESLEFSLLVDWDGEVTSRKTEMLDHLKIMKL